MQVSSTPLKWTIPFAQGDGARVEIPTTTADPTRFSLTLGSPPLTGQPPETGGVPPQLEDFNGAMNQIARIAWWKMGGGAFPYDATFATDPNVNGYPQGANVAATDYSGTWLSLVDNNTANPDTVVVLNRRSVRPGSRSSSGTASPPGSSAAWPTGPGDAG